MQIETERLKIYEKSSALKSLETIFTDEKTMKFYPQFILTERLTIERLLAMLDKAGILIYPFLHKESGKTIGFITLNNIEEYCKRIEVGYFLDSGYWGCGYAREIVSAVLSCLKRQGWHRIEATVYSGNNASQKVLDSCGFTLEGVLRDKYVIKGKYHDELIYSIIEPAN